MKNWKPEIIYRDPKSLTPYARNAKIHSTEQIDKIAGQIASVGFTQPIVIDTEGVIIAGHGRREASIRLGLQEVPVVVASHLNEYEAMAARIADNKVAEAPWDPALLKFDLGTLKMHEFNLTLTGFELPHIESILKPLDADNQFTDSAKKNVQERKEDYNTSEVRQIILVCGPEQFNDLMLRFSVLQDEFRVETNIDVVENLMRFYEENRPKKDPAPGALPETTEGAGQ